MSGQTGNFPYGKDLKSYHYGEVVTPYQKPQKEFDMMVGQHIQKARMWRYGFVAATGFSIFLVLILIMIMNSSPFSIYAVGVTNKGYIKSYGMLYDRFKIPGYAYKQFIEKTLKHITSSSPENSEIWLKAFLSEDARYDIERFVKINIGNNKYKLKDFKISDDDEVNFSLEIYNASGISQTFILKSLISTETPQKVSLIELNPLGFYMEELVFRVTLGDGVFNKLGKDDGRK